MRITIEFQMSTRAIEVPDEVVSDSSDAIGEMVASTLDFMYNKEDK